MEKKALSMYDKVKKNYDMNEHTADVSIEKARLQLGWEPRLSNAETLRATYDWYLSQREEMRAAGLTHRVPWDQRALGLLKRLS